MEIVSYSKDIIIKTMNKNIKTCNCDSNGKCEECKPKTWCENCGADLPLGHKLRED